MIRKIIIEYKNAMSKECWAGLEEGTELICKKGEIGFMTLGGTSINLLIEHKIYKVIHLGDDDIAYVKDETGRFEFAQTKNFELNKFDKRKYILQQI